MTVASFEKNEAVVLMLREALLRLVTAHWSIVDLVHARALVSESIDLLEDREAPCAKSG